MGIDVGTNNPKEITLSGFIFMEDREPDDFEVCLIIEKTGHLSAGCWLKGKSEGVFSQGRGGTIDSDYVLAWLPIESVTIDINDWNPAI